MLVATCQFSRRVAVSSRHAQRYRGAAAAGRGVKPWEAISLTRGAGLATGAASGVERLEHIDSRANVSISVEGDGAQVELCPIWSDHLTVEVEGGELAGDALSVQREEGGDVNIRGVPAPGGVLRVHLPQVLGSVQVFAPGASVRQTDKVEASVAIHAGGDVSIGKARGDTIVVESAGGAVHVGSLLEGSSVVVSAREVRAKRIVCGTLDVNCEGNAVLDSVYATNARVGAADVVVQTMHGAMHAVARTGNAAVSGILGSATAEAGSGDATLQFDEQRGDSTVAAGGVATVFFVPPADVDVDAAADGGALSLGDRVREGWHSAGPSDGAEGAARGRLLLEAGPSSEGASSGKITRERGSGMYDTSRAFFLDSTDAGPGSEAAAQGERPTLRVRGRDVVLEASSWIEATLRRIKRQRGEE